MANLPSELKQLKRFIREAKKTEKVSPIIAYYCRLYAIQEAMKLDESKKTVTTKQWMSLQMSKLEENKVECTREEAKEKITSMAHNVFKHADEIDRAGKANKSTAAAFNSSFVFYTILKQFGDRDDQIVEAAKYCMFKTTDILKALKEGRKPKPGPPGDDNDDELNQELANLQDPNDIHMDNAPAHNNDNFASPPQPSYKAPSPQPQAPLQPSYGGNNNYNNYNNYNQPPQPSYNQAKPTGQHVQQPVQPQPQSQPQSGQYYVNNGPNYNYQKQMQLPRFEKKVEACVEAERILKEALAALRFEDVDTAIKKAEEAIGILQPHNC